LLLYKKFRRKRVGRSGLFNDTVNFSDYTVLMIGELNVNVEHQCNDNDMTEPKHSEKNCHSAMMSTTIPT
jgi:hypothetical protein